MLDVRSSRVSVAVAVGLSFCCLARLDPDGRGHWDGDIIPLDLGLPDNIALLQLLEWDGRGQGGESAGGDDGVDEHADVVEGCLAMRNSLEVLFGLSSLLQGMYGSTSDSRYCLCRQGVTGTAKSEGLRM